MIEYCLVLDKENAAKLAERADKAGFNCDLEYLQEKVIEWLNDENRLTHKEK